MTDPEYHWSAPDSPGPWLADYLAHHPLRPPAPPAGGDLAAWQQRERARILDALHYDPGPFDPSPEVDAVVEHPTHRTEFLRFNTTPWSRVPAALLIPAGRPGPFPALAALHDHGGMFYWGKEKIVATPHDANPVLARFKRDYYGGRSLADTLAARGFMVLVIDLLHWGERGIVLDGDPDLWRQRPTDCAESEVAAFNAAASSRLERTGRALTATGATWLGMMLWDDRRSVEYLLTRPEADPDRIGCIGLSLGGYRSAWLAFMEPRIRAAVITGWMCRLRDCLDRTHSTIGHMKGAPGVFGQWDLPDLAALRVPRATQVLHCRQDALFPLAGMERASEIIRGHYRQAGAETAFESRMYDLPHCFSAAMQDDAARFLERQLTDRIT